MASHCFAKSRLALLNCLTLSLLATAAPLPRPQNPVAGDNLPGVSQVGVQPSGFPSGRFSNTLFPHPLNTATNPPLTQTTGPLPVPTSVVVPSTVESTGTSVPTSTQETSTTPSVGPQRSSATSLLTTTATSPSASISTPLPTLSSTSLLVPTTGSTSILTTTQPSTTTTPQPVSGNTFQLSIVTNADGKDANAYISGIDKNGNVIMLTTDGSFYTVPSPGSTTPQAIAVDVAIPLSGAQQATTIVIPDYISSARVWVVEGTLDFFIVDTQFGPALVEPSVANSDDPSFGLNWGFVEFTFNAEIGLFANLSYVDFVGLPLGMDLTTQSNSATSAPGMPADAVTQVCNQLKTLSSRDGLPWDELCVAGSAGNPMRVISPAIYMQNNSTAFDGYWNPYVDQVYDKYSSQPLTIDTQMSAGRIDCTGDGSTITCPGDSIPYPKPSAADIFGCNSGPFANLLDASDIHRAVLARMCAAFNRGTFLLPGGDVQPSVAPELYYTDNVFNKYSAVVHEVEIDGRGYAFSYDDVSPSDGQEVAGIVAAADPQVLTIHIS